MTRDDALDCLAREGIFMVSAEHAEDIARAFGTTLDQIGIEPTPVTWGYVLTAHTAHGSEARRATVFLPRDDERSRFFRKETTLPSGQKAPFSARFVYTAMTRAKTLSMMVLGT